MTLIADRPTKVAAKAEAEAEVRLAAVEQDSIIGLAAANHTKAQVPAYGQELGEARAWDGDAVVD